MSSNTQAPGQPGQQGGQSRPVKPEDIDGMPHLTNEQKARYKMGLEMYWKIINTAQKGTPEYNDAATKIRDATKNVHARFLEWQRSQQANASQSQPSQQPQSQATSAAPSQQTQPSASQPRPPISQQAMQMLQSFPFALPPELTAGTPEAEKYIASERNQYLKLMVRAEQVAGTFRKLHSTIEQRQKAGQPIPDDALEQRKQAEMATKQVKQLIDEFRKKHDSHRQQAQQSNTSQVKVEQSATTTAPPATQDSKPQAAGPQAQRATQQPAQAPQAQPASTQASNPAVDAARNNANMNRSPTGPDQPQRMGQLPPTSFAPSMQAPGAPNQQMPQQPGNITRPSLNIQQPGSVGSQIHQNSPHAQSANSAGPPVPLTHQAAMASAARNYADSRSNSAQQNITQSQQQMGSRDSTGNSVRYPIPKNLNIPAPQPVAMPGPSRPTMAGQSTGNVPGMLGQPVIGAQPKFHLEGDGDRVLSKKKLDELVRQVTGGGDGVGGEGLTPEVEDAVLQMADDFVDQLLTSACRLAKLRDSQQLEVRDIQLVLERNYNIRIPGYASDEVRTVRKFHPAPGWTQKMNAVQAAKVMSGKPDL